MGALACLDPHDSARMPPSGWSCYKVFSRWEPAGDHQRSRAVHLLVRCLLALFARFVYRPVVHGAHRVPRSGPVRMLLASRPLALTGLISYGIYLWHQLVIHELQAHIHSWAELKTPFLELFFATLAITLVISTVSYLLVERPGIAVGHRWLLRQRERAAETGLSRR